MLKSINRNNRLFMLGNFLFALSYGLWMNLRQPHLLNLGARPAEIGTVFALVAIAGGLLPLPAGMLADRIIQSGEGQTRATATSIGRQAVHDSNGSL